MKYILHIFIILFAKVSLAQKDFQDTTWFDKDWKESNKSKAEYYRVYKTTNKGYLIKDMFINGNPQMISEARDIKPKLIKEGLTTYYSNKNEISSFGNYKNNTPIGKWISYDENKKDSIIWIAHEDGHKEYLRYTEKNKDGVYTIVEEMPEFPGGVNEFMNFMKKKTKYPKEAKKKGWEGKTYLNFIVNEIGEITSPKIVKSSGHDILDEEVLRVIKSMPNWKPGTQNGKSVSVSINVPFNFTL